MFRLRFSVAAILIACLAVFFVGVSEMVLADPIDVSGDFQTVEKSGIPAGWAIHTWEGYKPFPKVQTVPGPNGQDRALSLTEILGEDGGAIQTKDRIPARSGFVGRITFRARGRGEAWVTFYRWGEKNQWNGVIPSDRFQLSDIWQEQTITIPVDNGHAAETRSVSLAIGAIRSSEIEIADLKLDLEPTEIIGDRLAPARWTVFPAVHDGTVKPEELGLDQVPEALAGNAGQTVSLLSQKLDLTRILDETGETGETDKADKTDKAGEENITGQSVWLFSQWETLYEYDYTLAVRWPGALTGFLNGQKFVEQSAGKADSQDSGELTPITVRLKKGPNLLAFQLRQAKADAQKSSAPQAAILTLAGPKDLRGATRQLRLTEVWNSEDFDGQTVVCSGEPEVIQGNPTPGLLTVTGQGVFRTNKTLTIGFPNRQTGNPQIVTADANNSYFAAGLRIQNFGTGENPTPAAFEIQAIDGRQPGYSADSGKTGNSGKPAEPVLAVCRIASEPEGDQLTFTVQPNSAIEPPPAADKAAPPVSFTLAKKILPASITFGLTESGRWSVYVSSLVDSQSYFRSGTFDAFIPAKSPIGFRYQLIANAATSSPPAEITVDNLAVGLAACESKSASAPFQIDLIPKFDPIQAGWKQIFNDEFDGDQVDLIKWRHSSSSVPKHAKVHDGLLEISCDWNEQKTKVCSASLYSNERFGYGYYEARVKFRQQSGWWSAFWLCTHGPSNPFIDGWEIDIYEDYYMGPKNPGEPPRGVLDHNLHVFATGTLRSWNYNSILPGSPDDFYVVGCKWTPFEVSYYINGQRIRSEANHSPYDAVTFDPFHHAAGFVPLYAILSGCCGRSGGDPAKGQFPDSFFVDYVRIYEFPAHESPKVELTRRPADEDYIIRPGDTLHFEADVQPAKADGPKIQTVYLFDSGALIDYKTRPPYRFDVPVTKEFYDKTDFARPGRTGVRMDFDRGLHAYCIFAQDEAGNVGHSEPVVRLMRKNGQPRPWQGKPHAIPGVIMLPYYDEGGQGVAYSDGTPGNIFSQVFRPGESVDATPDTIGGISGSEWLKYTVKVEKTGRYTFRFLYGTPEPGQRGPQLMIDSKTVGEFQTPKHDFSDWRTDTNAELKDIPLTEGEHELILLFQGSYNAKSLTVE